MATTGAPLQRPLYAGTVTVTGGAKNVLALIRALGGNYTNCPGSSRSWNVQPDPANGASILLGDENVAISPQQCGLNMAAGSAFLDRASIPGMGPIGSIFVIAVSGSQLLNFMVFSE